MPATLHDTVKGSNINSFIVFAPFRSFLGTCKNDSLRKDVQTKPEKHDKVRTAENLNALLGTLTTKRNSLTI